MKLTLFFAAFFLLVFPISSGCASGNSARGAAGTLLPAGATPVAGTLKDLDGKLVLLSSLRGNVVLLDFFATWCEPCRAGLPRTEALVKSLEGRGLTGWAISIDDAVQMVPPFVAEIGLKLPVLWDDGAHVADGLNVQLLPTMLLLDRSGAVRYRSLPDDPNAEEHLQKALAALLDEKDAPKK